MAIVLERELKVSDLQDRQSAVIKAVVGSDEVQERFFELGCIPGTEVTLLSRVSMGGPAIIEIRGCRIAIRRNDLNHLLVY